MMEEASIKAIGKLDMLNQIFRQEATFYTIDDGDGFCMIIGNSRYFFNPVIKTDTYEDLQGKTHTRKYLKYDGWEKSLARPNPLPEPSDKVDKLKRSKS